MDKKLTNPSFINKFRSNPEDFTRTRSFTFKSLSLFIIYTLQSSIQRELDRFFKAYNNLELAVRFVTQSAFTQARSKIKHELFIELRNDVVEHFYSHYDYKKWHGFRLVAIDGSEIYLPKNQKTIDEFGEYTTNLMKSTVVLARSSKAYDVLNKITIDAELVNKRIGEHSLAIKHLNYCNNDDLILLDRGYPSFDLFKNILDSSCNFCARVPISNWKPAKELVESGENERLSFIMPGYYIRKRYEMEKTTYEPIKCRFILIRLKSGQNEVLITSLLDMDKYPHSLFEKLYQLRWDVEESYKKDKHRLQLENFSGKSIVAINQDFHATMLMANITAILTFDIAKKKTRNSKSVRYNYQVNFTTALAKVKDAMALLFSGKLLIKIIEELLNILSQNILPIRPDRSFPRNKYKRKRYHKAYLTL